MIPDIHRLAQLDVSRVVGGFYERGLDRPDEHRDFILPGLLHRTILLRVHPHAPRTGDRLTLENWGTDWPVEDRPILRDWPEAQGLLSQARRTVLNDPLMRDEVEHEAPIARVSLSIVDPGGWVNWHTDPGDYAATHARFHIPWITDDAAVLYAMGAPPENLPLGALTYLNTQVPHSVGNWTDIYRTHLIFEMRRRKG